MNNKIITAIVCGLIIVCLSVGIAMNSKNSNSEKEKNSISSIESKSVSDSVISETENSSMSTANKTASDVIKSESETKASVKKPETEKISTQTVSKAGKKETSEKNTEKKEISEKNTEKRTEKKETKTSVKVTENQNIRVFLSINCERAAEKAKDYDVHYPKYLISKTKCNVKKGTTVFDLLIEECGRNGITVVHQNKSYIKAIGGLSEKDCGNASGWIYKVNGVQIMMSASKCVLKDGDSVEWYYVTSPTD